MRITPHGQEKASGFTLFEVIISLSILAMLTGSVVLISQTALQFSQTIIETQDQQLHEQEVEDHLERHLWDLSPNSRISLHIDESNQNIQTLSITRPDHSFPLNGKDVLAGETAFIGVFNSSGLLDLIQLHYVVGEDGGAPSGGSTHDKETLLLEDLTTLQWHFYDETSLEWLPEWEEARGIPKRIRFSYQHAEGSVTNSHVIWLQPSISSN